MSDILDDVLTANEMYAKNFGAWTRGSTPRSSQASAKGTRM